ncbi:TonB-dependent receptor [Vibrio porteresiae]|uniref:TonB-dependent receptor plug domain-containing protein n=1 Tax=Vibrio porteresiae DSM 19223 TaxID=1123496 RepID=A0ABZ0QFG8_9VIBR|nr:hypothetical protein [Vibrio porteresiae]WPC75154.1 hypothetical protein R8Z52_08140 [Vibrio porteresiae DSM 19223]
MKFTHFSLAVVAITPCSNLVYAEPIELGELEIVESTVQDDPAKTVGVNGAPVMSRSYDPIDTGKTVIDKNAMALGYDSGVDTTKIIQDVPGVQLDVNESQATQEKIQSLRPADFSINGGAYYENNIMIDGIGVNSVMDVTSNSYGDVDGVAGVTSQIMYVDASLLGTAQIMTNNVSAEYGGFLGGAVNYDIRDPAKEFHMTLNGRYQNDSFLSYVYAKSDLDEGEELIAPPDFSKYKGTLAFDLPMTDSFFVLASYSRGESKVKYTNDESYGGENHFKGDTSEQYLLKSLYEYRDDLTFRGTLLYSPYRSEYSQPNQIDNYTVHHTDGLKAQFQANGYVGLTTWESKLAYVSSDMGKESADYQVNYRGASVDWCSATTCWAGGYGNLGILQEEYTWKSKVSTPLWLGNLDSGLDLKYTHAENNRLSDYYTYSGARSSTWNCADDDISCTSTSAARTRILYPENSATVSFASQALWSQYTQPIGPVELRLGLRYEHDEFLDNHNISPRVTATWEFMEDTYFTVGANRYYANDMVGYALKAQSADKITYTRTLDSSTGDVGEWTQSRVVSATKYNNAKLKTPHSDELVAAFIFPTALEGKLQLEAVYRKNRDRFALSQMIESDDGDYYEMTNEGKSDYRGYTIKWNGGIEHHKFGMGLTWSETKSYGQSDYTDIVSDVDTVYYHGDLVTNSELYSSAAANNFAAPITAKLSWTADWFSERLVTNTELRYRHRYSAIGDTKENITIDGSSYDVYDEIERPSFTSVNMKILYKLIKQQDQQLNVTAEITNVFNRIPYTDTTASNRYQIGRQVWIGFNYYM